MFQVLKNRREQYIEKRYLLLKEKYEKGCSFSDKIFNKFIDLEIKYNDIQKKKRNKLNVVSIKGTDSS
jgi:hypothetical protein